MSRERRYLTCRTCGDQTWTFDHAHISAECRRCTYQRQLIADGCDTEEAMWREDDEDTGLYDEWQFDELIHADVSTR